MTYREARKLKIGVYRMWFKKHGPTYSVAVVGRHEMGHRFFLPSNWPDRKDFPNADPCYAWDLVERVEAIELHGESQCLLGTRAQ